jgi:ubiquinone/menaquinone biosynthesis C-methylase UbiE
MPESSRSDAQGRSASYRLEDLDADAELRRLQAQVDLVVPVEHQYLRDLGLTGDHTLVDVGCGPGYFSERVAAAFMVGPAAGGQVIGVDVDPSLVALATARAAQLDLPLSYRVGTASRIPVDDNTGDLIYARFIFQHLEDPAAVLAEMVRVARPGGLVAVLDTDDGSLVVHPEPAGFGRLLNASAAAQRARGGDRHVGRKLKAYLLDAGLSDVRVATQPFTSEGVGAERFLAITTGFKAGVLGPPHITTAQVDETMADLQRVAAMSGFFGHALGYLAWGRKLA